MSSSSAGAGTGTGTSKVLFGPYDVSTQVFLTTPHSFALVNLKPLLPGHVLVCPHAPHRRLTDLSAPELTDLMLTVQRVQRMLAAHYFPPPAASSSSSISSSAAPQKQQQEAASSTISTSISTSARPEDGSFNIALQDGAGAGQTVSHVHVHVIPRIRGATAKPEGVAGDALYEGMAAEVGNVGGALWDRAQAEKKKQQRPRPGGGFPRIEDADRAARSMEEMEAEAAVFRALLERIE